MEKGKKKTESNKKKIMNKTKLLYIPNGKFDSPKKKYQ